MSAGIAALSAVMVDAVAASAEHVEAGGLPFVGAVVNTAGEVLSEFGVNRVAETGDPTAHAEVVAMRDAMSRQCLETLAGCVLLATGEPCGLCYRYAIDHGIDTVYVAVDRDVVASLGFDYRSSYPAFGITDLHRAGTFRPLPVDHGIDPFTRYLHLHFSGRESTQPGADSKGTPS